MCLLLFFFFPFILHWKRGGYYMRLVFLIFLVILLYIDMKWNAVKKWNCMQSVWQSWFFFLLNKHLFCGLWHSIVSAIPVIPETVICFSTSRCGTESNSKNQKRNLGSGHWPRLLRFFAGRPASIRLLLIMM